MKSIEVSPISEAGIAQSFIFVPFKFTDGTADRDAFIHLLEYAPPEKMRSCGWKSDAEYGHRYENRYLLRYVSDRFHPVSSESTHQQEKESALPLYLHYLRDISNAVPGFVNICRPFICSENGASFQIKEIHLYLFSTGIGILSYLLNFQEYDAHRIADVLYYIKKATRPCLRRTDTDGVCTDFMDISLSVTESLRLSSGDQWEFFFFDPAGGDFRCNTLSLLEFPCPADNSLLPDDRLTEEVCREQLFYLSNGYGAGFGYMREWYSDHQGFFRTASDRFWGISQEGAACLAPISHDRRGEYTEGQFHENFLTQYLFMYILALHQKYELYNFLTTISGQMHSTVQELKELEQYRNKLSLFEKDFCFSVISEVPQYQIVYEHLCRTFNLQKMYNDVHEPLASLSKLQQEMQEKAEKERDEKVTAAINMLSVLAVFSALVDSFDLLEELIYGEDLPVIKQLPPTVAWILLITDLVLIILFFIVRVVIPLRKDKEK